MCVCVCVCGPLQLTSVYLPGCLLWLTALLCSPMSLNGVLLSLLSYFIQMDLPDEEPDRLSNKLLKYDPSQDQWTERAPMQYAKYRFSTAVVNSEIYVLGKRKLKEYKYLYFSQQFASVKMKYFLLLHPSSNIYITSPQFTFVSYFLEHR